MAVERAIEQRGEMLGEFRMSASTWSSIFGIYNDRGLILILGRLCFISISYHHLHWLKAPRLGICSLF
jgi:hypothetical protein